MVERFVKLSAKVLLAVGIVSMFYGYGCTPVPYRVCDGQNVCRNMSKAEALEAAQVHKEWQSESTLKLGIAKP